MFPCFRGPAFRVSQLNGGIKNPAEGGGTTSKYSNVETLIESTSGKTLDTEKSPPNPNECPDPQPGSLGRPGL